MGAKRVYGRGMPRPIAEVNYNTEQVAFTNGNEEVVRSRHAATQSRSNLQQLRPKAEVNYDTE